MFYFSLKEIHGKTETEDKNQGGDLEEEEDK